jgi:shikimate kinase
MSQPVVLVGLMGSGKTSVGTRLAKALRRPFRDSDEDLARRYGQSAAQQQRAHGTEVLHDRETAVLRAALDAPPPPPVIAAAASTVDDPDARAALSAAYVVWLDAPPSVLAHRIQSADHRPHYHPDPEVMLTRQYEQRADHLRAVADLRVDVAENDPDQSAAAVLAALSRAGRPRRRSG